MKTITMYELLGLVKDGKELPKLENKAERDFAYYVYVKWGETCNLKDLKNLLNEEVEILEEEKEIPEKLETYKEIDDEEHYANILKVSKNGECEIDEATSVIVDKINSIIDYLKSKGE